MKGVLAGLGGRGFSWIKVCERHPDVELVGFVDPVEDRRVRAVEELGISESRLFNSMDVALDSTDPDFAVDITPPGVHERVAIQAFEAGLNVLQKNH